ncbi:unnamed protein product [Ectocarpus fasciculatus]
MIWVLSAVWPITLVIGLCGQSSQSETRRSRPAARRSAGSRVRSSPPVPNTWREGGWLVMMRARHQRSLARPKGYMAKLRQLREGRRKYSVEFPTATSGGPVRAGNQDDSDIELAEEGLSASRTGFRRVVVTVVAIEEEGLFRHIITYL